MDCKIIKRLLLIVSIFYTTQLSAIEFKGEFLQGHYIIGITNPSAKIIVDKKYLNTNEISSIEERVKSQILECEKFAEESPYPDVSVMYDAVYEQENYPFLKHKPE